MTVKKLEGRVRDLIEADTENQTDRAWVVAVYVSLLAAEELGYQKDVFITLSLQKQETALLCMVSEGLLTHPSKSDDSTIWRSGYFYNNAVFRMAALTEIKLEQLCKAESDISELRGLVGSSFYDQACYYKKKFGKSLEALIKVRAWINEFKHEPTNPESNPSAMHKAEPRTMENAIGAFVELLDMLELLTNEPKR